MPIDVSNRRKSTLRVSAAVSVVLRNRVALARLARLMALLGARVRVLSQVTITPGFSTRAGRLDHVFAAHEESRAEAAQARGGPMSSLKFYHGPCTTW